MGCGVEANEGITNGESLTSLRCVLGTLELQSRFNGKDDL